MPAPAACPANAICTAMSFPTQLSSCPECVGMHQCHTRCHGCFPYTLSPVNLTLQGTSEYLQHGMRTLIRTPGPDAGPADLHV